jgi:glutaredoxin/glutathione-dependent peroxiredoxin
MIPFYMGAFREDQLLIWQANQPGIMLDFFFELAGPPAGIAKRKDGLLRAPAAGKILQNVARCRERDAAADFQCRFLNLIVIRMQNKSSIAVDRSALQDKCIGCVLGLLNLELLQKRAQAQLGYGSVEYQPHRVFFAMGTDQNDAAIKAGVANAGIGNQKPPCEAGIVVDGKCHGRHGAAAGLRTQARTRGHRDETLASGVKECRSCGTDRPLDPERMTFMTIAVGDRLPDAQFQVMGEDGMQTLSTADVFEGKTVALFAVPGAFTPTCSARHLPGFKERASEFKSHGVDVVACIAVNDVFVMNAWGKDQHVGEDVVLLADGGGHFTRAIGLELDTAAFGGARSQRYSMLVRDAVVTKINIENAGQFEVSDAETLLGQLRG